MNKTFLFFFVALIAVSCGRKSDSSKAERITYYVYGNQELRGSLPELDAAYRPANLSEKTFTQGGASYSPVNLRDQDLSIELDASTMKAVGDSLFHFEVRQTGRPYFELQGPVTTIKLDGTPVTVVKLTDPDGQGQSYIGVDQEVLPGAIHTFEVTYDVPSDRVGFSAGGASLLTSMTDVSNAHFFECWGPVGFEDDSFKLNLHLKVLNTSVSHRLFTNGTSSTSGPSQWDIEFPEYFTRSSFFVHLTNNGDLLERNLVYHGLERDIPITVYGPSSVTSLLDQASLKLPILFAELEGDFGPYAHPTFTAYVHGGGGGMEYSGATITSLVSIGHELFHSWFARGVMPAEGRSGWIDEGMASWRDNGYFQAGSLLTRSPTNLAGYSPFRKSTASNCYVDGRNLMAELDREFLDFGGMKPLMAKFFQRYKHRVVTNEELWHFLSALTQMNVDAFFFRYTLGTAVSPEVAGASLHPSPLTQAEVEGLR